MKDVQATGEASLKKESIQHFKQYYSPLLSFLWAIIVHWIQMQPTKINADPYSQHWIQKAKK